MSGDGALGGTGAWVEAEVQGLRVWLYAGCVVSLWVGAAAAAEGPEAPAAEQRPAVEVVDALLAARSKLQPLEAEFSWVIGPLGVDQQRMQGRLYVVGPDRYRVDFETIEAGGGMRRILVVPDGRWAYEFSQDLSAVGMRVDLTYLRRRVRSPAPRVRYDPTGGALLELLRFRGYLTYEGDQEVPEGRSAVLSHRGPSFRVPQVSTQEEPREPISLTRLYYRWEDGLLLREEEVNLRGQEQSRYQASNIRPLQPWPELLQVPEAVRFVDATKQLVRRILYGPPRPAPRPEEPSAGSGAGLAGP